MNATQQNAPIQVLLVEDNLSDIQLTQEVLSESSIWSQLNVVRDGEEAIAFLKQIGKYADAPRPQLVLLDLNLPRKNGREVLAEVKQDPELKRIPILILSTSGESRDIDESYSLYANCYLVKPSNIEDFSRVVRAIEEFWMTLAILPA